MLTLQYFDHLMRRTDSLEKNLMLGKIEGWKRMDDLVMGREAWHAAVHGVV